MTPGNPPRHRQDIRMFGAARWKLQPPPAIRTACQPVKIRVSQIEQNRQPTAGT
jgi:hypothetical protein